MDTYPSYPPASFAADSVNNNDNKTNGGVDNLAFSAGDSVGINMPMNGTGDVEVVAKTENQLGRFLGSSERSKSTPSISKAPPPELGADDAHGIIEFICKPKVRSSFTRVKMLTNHDYSFFRNTFFSEKNSVRSAEEYL